MDLECIIHRETRVASEAPSTAQSASPRSKADSTETTEEESSDELTSLSESVVDYEYENGRRYHGYKAGSYPLPNDGLEMERLDWQHHITKLVLDGELHLAPLKSPRKILDLGTGTGIWAIEMGERYPKARLIGIDLSPTQPEHVPANVRFEVDDLECDWLYRKDSFDLIHSRYMTGAIANWRKMIAQAFKHCRPGGFVELQELDMYNINSDDGTKAEAAYLQKYVRLLHEATRKYKKPVPGRSGFTAMLDEAGFIEIEEHSFKVPLNSWPQDEKLKAIGKCQFTHYDEHLEGMSVGLFSRALGWQPDEIQVLLAHVRKELKNPAIRCYQMFTVVVGRKPGLGEKPAPKQSVALDSSTSTMLNPRPQCPDLRPFSSGSDMLGNTKRPFVPQNMPETPTTPRAPPALKSLPSPRPSSSSPTERTVPQEHGKTVLSPALRPNTR